MGHVCRNFALQTMPARPGPLAFLTLAASAPRREPRPGRRGWRRLLEPICSFFLARQTEETTQTDQEFSLLLQGKALPQVEADGPRLWPSFS